MRRSPTTENLCNLDFDLSRSLRVKYEGVIGLPVCGFLFIFNSNIGLNWAPLRDIRLRNLNDLASDLSMTSNIKSDGIIRLTIYDFLLLYNSIWYNLAHLRHIRLSAGLDFVLGRSLKVKCHSAIRLSIRGFLLMLIVYNISGFETRHTAHHFGIVDKNNG